MESESPEVPGVGRAVAVGGPTTPGDSYTPGEVGTFHGFAGASAFDGSRVDEPDVVGPRRARPGEVRDDVLEEFAGTKPFVVPGALGQVREPGAEVVVRVADEPGFGCEPNRAWMTTVRRR